jgi:ankyrin repeat protein
MHLLLLLVSFSSVFCSFRTSLWMRPIFKSEASYAFFAEQLRLSIAKTEITEKMFASAMENDTDSIKTCLDSLYRIIPYVNHVNMSQYNQTGLIHFAARHGSVMFLDLLCTYDGIDLELANFQNLTALQIAVDFNQIAFVAELLRKGARLSYMDHPNLSFMAGLLNLPESSKTLQAHLDAFYTHFPDFEPITLMRNERKALIHLAARIGNLKILELLCLFGVDLELRDAQNYSALSIALKFNQIAFAIHLIEKDVKVDYSFMGFPNTFFFAVFKKLPELISTIRSRVTECELKILCSDDHYHEATGFRLIHAAALRHNIEILEICNILRLNLESRDKFGRTPLYLAAEAQNHTFVIELVRLGAAVEYPIMDHPSLIHFAVANNSISMLKEIRNAGHDIGQICTKWYQPVCLLELTIKKENFEIAAFLARAGLPIRPYKLDLILKSAIDSGNASLAQFIRDLLDFHLQTIESSKRAAVESNYSIFSSKSFENLKKF